MKCPKCKLENPESAGRCDCGYDFISKEMKGSSLGNQHKVASKGFISVGYITSVFAPLIGLFIGGNIYFSKDSNNLDGYKYDMESRYKGKLMFITSIVVMIIILIRGFIKTASKFGLF